MNDKRIITLLCFAIGFKDTGAINSIIENIVDSVGDIMYIRTMEHPRTECCHYTTEARDYDIFQSILLELFNYYFPERMRERRMVALNDLKKGELL